MILYPAIDLLDGQCVRLHKGDFAQKTSYGNDPVAVARDFQAQGATWLHLVDLSGAKDPSKRQTALIAHIIKQTGLSVQTGGGVRNAADVTALLNAGAARVVIGSLAVKDVAATTAIFKHAGAGKICLALDMLDGRIAVSGWQEATETTIESVIDTYLPHGLTDILCTDISRDGTMAGPNTTLYARLVKAYPALHIQASGGIGSIDDITALTGSGVAGAIAGKAIYEGRFTLAQGLGAASC